MIDVGPVYAQARREHRKTRFPYISPRNISDDCLYINVWTPSLEVALKLYVMIWIYGGAFQRGNIKIKFMYFAASG